MSEREISAYLGHIVMAMDAIAEYISGMTDKVFYDDRKTQDAVRGLAQTRRFARCVISELTIMSCGKSR